MFPSTNPTNPTNPTKAPREEEFEYRETGQLHVNALEAILESTDDDDRIADALAFLEVVSVMRYDASGNWWHRMLEASRSAEPSRFDTTLQDTFELELDLLQDVVLFHYLEEASAAKACMGAQRCDDFDFGDDEDNADDEAAAGTASETASDTTGGCAVTRKERKPLPTYTVRPAAMIVQDFVLTLVAVKRLFASQSTNQVAYLTRQLNKIVNDPANNPLLVSHDLRREGLLACAASTNLYGARATKTADIGACFRRLVAQALLAVVNSHIEFGREDEGLADKFDVSLLVNALHSLLETETRFTEQELALQNLVRLSLGELESVRSTGRRGGASGLFNFFRILYESAALCMAMWRARMLDRSTDGDERNILDLERAAVERANEQAELEADTDVEDDDADD